MERLTTKHDGDCVPKGLCTVDGFGKIYDVSPCNIYCDETCSKCVIQKCFDKLAYYEDLEEQGLLLKLKCKIGDTIYSSYLYKYTGRIEEAKVIRITRHLDESVSYLVENKSRIYTVEEKDLGKIYFLTKAEAEKALKEMKE